MLRETANGHFHASRAGHLLGGDVPCRSSMRRSLGRVRFGCSEASNAESMQETPLALQGALSKDRGRVGSGTRMYWYVSIYIGMY